LLGRNAQAGVDLSGSPIDAGETLRRKEMVEVFGFLKVLLQHIGDAFVNAAEAGLRRAAPLGRVDR
jgi:hypothetical protein